MKHPIKIFFRSLTILLSTIVYCFISQPARAQEQSLHTDFRIDEDSITLSLLTCSPREEVYSLYGHTAIRYVNLKTNEDWVFNYGVFNFNKPYFTLRFAFGLTDYELGVMPFHRFYIGYKNAGCKVVEQVLNLTSEEKQSLIMALDENYKPENKVYRYNYFYDNCTTRARDIIERCIGGVVEYRHQPNGKSYRNFVHAKAEHHPWMKLGNDLCLGILADLPTTPREQQFLPENLMCDFDSATIVKVDGKQPLVIFTRVLFDTSKPTQASSFATTPFFFVLLFAFISAIIAYFEFKRKKTYRTWDITLMSLTGITGVLIAVLFVSQHPTTSTNLHILLLNPLSLLFIGKVLKRRKTIYWRLYAISLILFLIGSIFQDYPNEIFVLALCLLVRCWINLKYPAIQKKNK